MIWVKKGERIRIQCNEDEPPNSKKRNTSNTGSSTETVATDK